MFKSKFLWAFILGVLTAVLFFEAKINLVYSPVWTRILGTLTAPGTHLATSLNQPGVLLGGWQKFWTGLAFACNLVVYTIIWYVLIAITSYMRSRHDPYDRENTLVPPVPR